MEDRSREVIANIYAKPVFELALESQIQEKVGTELAELAKLLKQERDFVSILGSPFIGLKERIALVKSVFAESVSQITLGLIECMVKRNRLKFISDIHYSYQRILDESKGINLVRATLAEQLDPEKLARFKAELEEAAGGPVKLEIQVDPRIIGGVILEQGDILIDNSVRAALASATSAISNKAG